MFYFAGVGKMAAEGNVVVLKMELDEKDAGGLLGDTKNNEKTDKP